MASRTFTPMLRQAVRVSQRNAMAAPCRRFLNTETAPSLYTAKAHVVGARTGYAEHYIRIGNILLTPFQTCRRREPQGRPDNGQSPWRLRRCRKDQS
ncbi:OsmC-like protein [Alternaria alternata]|nr:OsmC-like protein [Alternaria alternata]